MGRNRRVTRRLATIAAAFAFVVLAAGCLSINQTPEIVGRVKIVDPTSVALSQSAWADAETMPLAGPTRTGLSRLSTDVDTEPTYEYIVHLQPRADSPQFKLAAQSLGFQVKETSDQYQIVKDRRQRPISEAIWVLRSLNEVSSVEQNGKIVLLDTDLTLLSATGGYDAATPYWALQQIRAPEAWEVSGQGDGIIVAVVDTGIDFTHPALADESMWVEGRNFAKWDSNLSDCVDLGDGTRYGYWYGADLAGDHGTKVARIIGAREHAPESNAMGVAPQVRMMPLRVFDDVPNYGTKCGSEKLIEKAISFAIENGADVINLSLGKNDGTDCTPILQRALNEAWAAGLTVVAASGNQGMSRIVCPARHPTVISVGASNEKMQRSDYSNFGDTLDLLAPGGEGTPDVGTSYAAPHVSGVAALMLAQGAVSFPDDIKHVLQMTAIDVGTPGFDEETGYGVVDAYLAVSAGIPQVFAARMIDDALHVAGRVALAGEGGSFRLVDVPKGVWTIVGWVDTDGDGVISTGDFFGTHEGVVVRDGRMVTSIELDLSPYDGEDKLVF